MLNVMFAWDCLSAAMKSAASQCCVKSVGEGWWGSGCSAGPAASTGRDPGQAALGFYVTGLHHNPGSAHCLSLISLCE